MTALFEIAVEAARLLPSDKQDEIARIVLLHAGGDGAVVDLTPEEEEAVLLSREAAERGEFATGEQMRAIWAKHGL